MRTIGGYVLEAKLGEGGMGTVFRATHPRFPGQVFALKVLRSAGPPSPQALARFQREAEALARVAAHPNVVRLLGAGVERDQPWYVMELVSGKSLADYVEENGPLEPVKAARVVADITRAIAHAHAQGVLHRDLKPENVLLDGERVLVCDFGLAKIAEEERLTRSGTLLGTPAYAAPEQIASKGTLDHRADIYGLGGVLMFVLTGAPPFEAATLHEAMAAAIAAPAPAPSSRREGIPRDLDAIVLRALQKEPARRYPDALSLVQDLDKVANGIPLARRARRSHARVAVGLLLLAVAVLASFVVPRLRDAVSGKSGPGKVGPSEDPEKALAALAARPAAERAAKLLDLEGALTAAGPGLDIVGEKGGAGAGLVILDEARRARIEGRGTADALFALAQRVGRARLDQDSADTPARELRALHALASRGAAISALGSGRVVGEIDTTTAADLAAATKLEGAPGKRAAWLLVERLVCERRRDEAAAALDRAARDFPDAVLAAAFGRILAPNPAPAVFAALRDRVTGTRAERVAAAAELARFLALEGAPGAIESPDLAAAADDAALDSVLAFEPGPLFLPPGISAPAPPEEAELRDLVRGHPDWRAQTARDSTERLEVWKAEVRAKAPRLIAACLAQAPDNWEVCRECKAAFVLGLAAIPFGLLDGAQEPGGMEWLEVAFSHAERELSNTGLISDFVGEELDRTLPDWDGALASAVSRNAPVKAAFETKALRDRLAPILVGAGALHRLELLEAAAAGNVGAEVTDSLVLTLEALRRMDTLSQVGGAGVYPFRARLRRLAFPGPLGDGHALLDMARAERAALEVDAGMYGAGNLARYAVACAAAAPPAGTERDLGRELYAVAVAWTHEDAIANAFYQDDKDPTHRITLLASALSEEKPLSRPYKTEILRYYADHDFDSTADDETRVRAPRLVKRQVVPLARWFVSRTKK